MRNMLVVDSAYCYADLKSRRLENFVLARDPGSFFTKIITVHPFAGVQFSDSLESDALYGRPSTYELDKRNLFIEGKRGRFALLKKFEFLNYALSFISIFKLVLNSLKSYKLDVVRAEDALLNGFIGWLLSSLTRTPLIIGIWANFDAIRRDTRKPTMPRLFKYIRLEQSWEKFILSRADIVLVGNVDNKNFVVAKGVNPSKIEVLPVVFNLSTHHFIEPNLRLPIDDDLFSLGIDGHDVIVCISRLEKVKLVDHVIRAVPYIRKPKREFKVLIVGEGSQLAELTALCQELSLTNTVIFCGNRDQDWISRLLSHCDVVVSPLTGRALAESAMAGAAVVAYDMEWQGELIETNKTGELVPRHDFVALAESISLFLENPNYKKRMGAALRESIIDRMNAIDIGAKTNALYEKVIIF